MPGKVGSLPAGTGMRIRAAGQAGENELLLSMTGASIGWSLLLHPVLTHVDIKRYCQLDVRLI